MGRWVGMRGDSDAHVRHVEEPRGGDRCTDERARGQDKGLPLGTARVDPPRVLFVLWMG